ncbi:hypothetical protein A3Q56_06833 [Intoshia linei]|uniref:Thioredoxin domain-containing protein n=1 Tax=Intoshia linei TaxID=1819745 RepID=A0A177AVP9_9BILA|nr:hypothetical protein A3Q56_06833 [Intoshia linei]
MNWCRDIELDSELTRCNVVVVYDHDCMDLIDLIFSNSFYTQISQKFNFKFLKYDYYSDECKKFSKLYSVICTPLVYFISKDSSECIVGDVTNENCIKHLKIFLVFFVVFNLI